MSPKSSLGLLYTFLLPNLDFLCKGTTGAASSDGNGFLQG